VRSRFGLRFVAIYRFSGKSANTAANNSGGVAQSIFSLPKCTLAIVLSGGGATGGGILDEFERQLPLSAVAILARPHRAFVAVMRVLNPIENVPREFAKRGATSNALASTGLSLTLNPSTTSAPPWRSTRKRERPSWRS
jgi:hypothetical protein